MATTNSEVSKKIRAAIKAKLEELGVYVDEELPDYIMVMIANKKEKTQMKDDLQLFLGKNSVKFVDWLFDIFERLQTVGTVSSAIATVETSQTKKKESDSTKSNEKSRDEVDERKRERKRRESDNKTKDLAKEREGERSKERDRDREKKEKEKERDKYEAKVVKSKPSSSSRRRDASPISSHDKTSTRKKSEHSSSHTRKESASSTGRREEERRVSGEKAERKQERKLGKEKQDERKNEEKQEIMVKSDTKKSKEREKYESPLKKATQSSAPREVEKAPRDVEKVSRKRRISPPKSISPIADVKTTHTETITRQQPKVSSMAVAKMPQNEQPKTVSSQVLVKRKLPDKENAKQQSGGVKSLFLKAIKEAGETTRIASQSAGYGGSSSHKKSVEAQKSTTKDEDELSVVEDGTIEIDDYGDLEDALVVMPATSSGGDGEHMRSVVHEAEECVESEQEIEPSPQKKKRILAPTTTKKEEPKFFITMKGQRVTTVASGTQKLKVSVEDVKKQTERTKKRRNEANPILAHLNLPLSDKHGGRKMEGAEDSELPQKKARKEQKNAPEGVENDAAIASDGAVVSEGSVDSRRTPVWDGQIQLEEDDSSDDEAQIDAVLASTQSITAGFDEVPPTPTLTKPAFFLAQNQSQPTTRSGQLSMPSPLASASGEKLMERCKFWPNCRLEENCVYIHPSKPCSNFPKCHFGDRCLYVHPLCKFDRTCTNPRCPYMHSLKPLGTVVAASTPTVASTPVKPVVPTAPLSSTIPCKFAGRCANANCTYKHPKLCRFGERCANRSCYFWHPKLNIGTALSAKYKWKASTSS
uniref:Zinc finger CCCH domain-containing protein 14 n=1 Tax=Ascaris suum TaxID=6253 RepID=F1KW82_ASCSU